MRALRAMSAVLGALPPGLGQAALARRLRARSSLPPTAVQRLRGGARFELHLTDRVQGEVFFMRRYEPALIAFLDGRLPAGGVLFDVGAHVGLVSIQVAVARGDVSVHAFEPSTTNAARLERNLALNPGASVRLIRAAVGEGEGEAELATAAGGADLAGSRILAEPGPRSESSVERVPLVTLDGYADEHRIERVHALKLDVEGSELAALGGAARLLSERRIGCLVCELNDVYLAERGLDRADVVERLRGFGYRPAPIPPVGAQRLRGASSEGDVVDAAFVPEGGA